MSVEFHNPIALLLLAFVPLVVFVSRRSLAGLPPVRSVVSTVLRCVIVVAVVLALADVHVTRKGDVLTTVFVVDQSRSVPDFWSRREVIRNINNVVRGAGPKDRIGLVLFGADGSIEKVPQPAPSGGRWISGISSTVDPDHTDIAGALRLARAVIPEGHKKRIVLFSDGNENSGVAIEEAERAKAAGVAVDVVKLEYSHAAEVLVEKVLLPARLSIGEPFKLRVVVWTQQACNANLYLSQDGYAISSPDDDYTVALAKGKNVFTYPFKDGLSIGGPTTFEARIEASREYDSIPENNRGVGYTYVESGEPKVLLIESDLDHAEYLLAALREEEMDVDAVDLTNVPAAHKFAGYDSIILSNVAAGDMFTSQMKAIERCVRDMGVGLVWLGGENSFGAGGWRNTPIERVSPISCDIKQKRVLPKGALVLIMDAAEVAQGNRWAVEMASEAVNALSARDEIAIMSSGEWLVPLRPVGERNDVLDIISNMKPGDVCDFNGMLKDAGRILKDSNASTKHIVLMSDAGPSEWEPSRFMVRQFNKRKITVTTVVFKDHFQGVVTIMERLAAMCKGSFYHPQQADELPRIFVKEAAVISRSLIHEEPFVPTLSATDYSPVIKGFDGFPRLVGHVVVTAKSDAEVPIVRTFRDKNEKEIQKDPVLAHRQEGLGRTLAFTSDAKNRWAADWVSWEGFKTFWSQAVRWTLRRGSKGGVHTPTIIEVSNGRAHGVVEALDNDGNPVPGLSMQGWVIRPVAEEDETGSSPVRMQQTGVARWECWFDANETGSYFLRCHYSGADNAGKAVSGDPIAGTVVAYSPEYRELKTNIPLIENIAQVTGGRILKETDDVFDKNLPTPHTSLPAWDWMLIAAIAAFPVDVFVRKVMIDREQIMTAAKKVAAGLPLVGERFEAALPAVDPAIAKLLAKKRQVREELDRPARQEQEKAAPSGIETLRAVQEGRRDASEDIALTDDDLELESAEPIKTDEPGKAGKRPAARPDAAKKDKATPYTQRLLQAKKRALKKKREE